MSPPVPLSSPLITAIMTQLSPDLEEIVECTKDLGWGNLPLKLKVDPNNRARSLSQKKLAGRLVALKPLNINILHAALVKAWSFAQELFI